MHPGLDRLHPYPFERLARLHSGLRPPSALAPISLSIGEPKHAPPKIILDALVAALPALGSYPATSGLPDFRQAAAQWLDRRYGLGGSVDADAMILPVNGTREALFSFAQAMIDPRAGAWVGMPNPFYQIYEGAALLAGATPFFLDTTDDNGFLPDLEAVSPDIWRRCALLYLCSPGNPTGTVASEAYMARALELADEHDFIVAADECYSDIYLDEASPPPGFLGACRRSGRTDFRRVVVFHSLSKRSSVPGLRSGFVAGDPRLIERFRLYRTYHGCALPIHVQRTSIPAWNDDDHGRVNRALYRAKFDAVLPILDPVLDVACPEASFYLWPDVGCDDEQFAKQLYAEQAVVVLPGSYLARDGANGNPGRRRIRISLVASLDECIEAAQRIRVFLESHRP
jgi:N-succinyldiaminopimelate aminotransferase